MVSPDAPGLAPPPGVEPYFYSPYSLNGYTNVVIAECIILTTIMVAARVYTKRFVVKSISLEDYMCVLGWASFIVFLGLTASVVQHGGGAHQYNLLYKDVQYNWRMNNYADMVYSVSLCATKLSIMLLIQRVFCSTQRDVPYWLTVFLISANTAFYLAFIIVPAAQCKPRSKIWNPKEDGTCVDIKKLYIASALFNTLSDVAMLSVPIYLIWSLQMSLRRKVGVSAIFCTGGLACISSILRAVYNFKLTKTEDYTYTHAQALMWALAEIAFGLLSSCLVVLPRLYQHFCAITPYTNATHTNASDPRSQTVSQGKSKREWVQLEEQAERARSEFSKKGRLEDEEALDDVLEDNRDLAHHS